MGRWPDRPVEERFWEKVAVGEPDECWPWLACLDKRGYGAFRVEGGKGGRTWRAYRFGYVLTHGQVPDGLELDHTCENRACCNPAHLEPVTHAENVRRASAYKDTCRNGHPFDAENTYTVPATGTRRCKRCQRARRLRDNARKGSTH